MRPIIAHLNGSQTLTGHLCPEDIVPDVHLLGLTLTIDPKHVLIDRDSLDHAFDYDPLVLEIDRLAQEPLITRIIFARAADQAIEAFEIHLYKQPTLRDSGSLGNRLYVASEDLNKIRKCQSVSVE